MHKVIRTEKPQILINKQEEWTEDLLKELEEKEKFSKVAKRCHDRYKHKEIKEKLTDMYGDLCCFCEGNAKISSFEAVEHFKPKAEFPDLCYEWSNLHQICSKCNGKKSNQWDSDNPIYDPSVDNVDDLLHYEKNILCYEENDIRGKNTIEHTGLNREELLKWRSVIFLKAMEKKNCPVENRKAFIDAAFHGDTYCSYRDYIKEYLDVK